MRYSDGGLSTWLATNPTDGITVDAYTIEPINLSPLYWCSSQWDISFGGHTYTAAGTGTAPLVERGDIEEQLGWQASELKLTLFCGTTARIATDVTPHAGAAAGLLDGAKVSVHKLFWQTVGYVYKGSVLRFIGTVATVEPTSGSVALTVRSAFDLLNRPFPEYKFQPSCGWQLWSAGCGLSATTYRSSVTVSGTATTTSIPTANGSASGYFSGGLWQGTSGANNGIVRSIRAFASGTFTLDVPLPTAPANGATFYAWPGCDKTSATCSAKFTNLTRFRGFPFVSPPSQSE